MRLGLVCVRISRTMTRFLLALVVALVSEVACPSGQTTAAGEWQMSYVAPSGPQEGTLYLSQEGPRLTGHISSEYGEYVVRGTLDGQDIKFSWTVVEQGKDVVFAVTGKLDGDHITGTIRVGNVGTTSFRAERTDDA
jgi:hypothetical protein